MTGTQGERANRLKEIVPGVDRRLVADHLARMDAEYLSQYTDRQIASHLEALDGLGPGRVCRLVQTAIGDRLWELTVVAFDRQGLFSLIAGSLASVGLSIERGEVWTYAEAPKTSEDGRVRLKYDFRLRRYVPKTRLSSGGTAADFLRRKKIVDIFTVRAVQDVPDWRELEHRLDQLIQLLQKEKGEETRRKVGRRVIEYLSRTYRGGDQKLMPVKVEVNNESSDRFTVMDIQAEDTPAFLFLFTNALAMRGVDILGIRIGTTAGEVHDRFFITDRQGEKIEGSERIDELKFIVALVKQFSHLLVRSPDPTMALTNFERLVERIWSDREKAFISGWKLLDLTEQPVLEALARLFGTSNFLWEDFLRLQYENLLPVFSDLEALDHYKDKADMWGECELELLGASDYEDAADRLNRFKDREMFRIDMRHILDKIENFSEFSRELTDLVEVVIEQAYRIADGSLRARYGNPLGEDGTACRFAVFALGKTGGCELGYASDIELLFVCSATGETTGPEKVSDSEYFEKLVQLLIKSVRAKRQGIFEIDLRFRPYGNQGPLCNTLRQMEEYYSQEGPAWDFERQCLVRLRPVAGDGRLGEQVCRLRDRFVYSGRPLHFAELARLRHRQQEEFVKAGTWNAKFSEGGLVDVEYHVQHLQIFHGRADPSVRQTSTRQALKALHAGGYIGGEEFEALLAGHDFLRRL
ncbi:MAG: hypothetical protein V1794_18350, partial [Candidatus Glassbacteria bacterium]